MIALNLNTLITAAPNKDRDSDHVDFAIAKLSDKITSKLSGAKFINEDEIEFSKTPSEGRIYTCLGFPNSKNKVNTYKGSSITPVIFPYTSTGRPASQLPNIASAADHTLVDYSKKYGHDENGNRVNMVALNGCSGGAIVDCGEISLRTLSEPATPKLIAVLIEAHSKEKVILGIRLSTIMAHLRESGLL